ncbi:MAG: inositol phosphorylceramide synthase [Muribaculaceae bacterium]|nr:inositol phosphorylceramide synthase [Muribaculaceae bacterium]
MSVISLPGRRESAIIAISLMTWLVVTALCVGFRPEHTYIALFLALMLFINNSTRRLVVALLPFVVFGISYDWMNIVPNYEVNPVDIRGLYESEKELFGITTAAGVVTPNEFFAIHSSKFMDFMAGVFYLCWVPVPILFGIWLYFNRQYKVYLHFALVFLFVNLLGFTYYYIHPAAPPWYVASHGFEFLLGTPGEVAGLGKFDEMTGLGIFHGLYSRNSNVFAALPSLHAAYMLIAFIYSLKANCSWWLRGLFAVICLGIWFTAVYTSHHYIIDVLMGIGCTLLGFVIFEYVLMKLPAFARFINNYIGYISSKRS